MKNQRVKFQRAEKIGEAVKTKSPVRDYNLNPTGRENALNAAFYYAKKNGEDSLVFCLERYGVDMYFISDKIMATDEILEASYRAVVTPEGDVYKAEMEVI